LILASGSRLLQEGETLFFQKSVVAEVGIGNLLLLQFLSGHQSRIKKGFGIDEIGISPEGGEGHIGRVEGVGDAEVQNLPQRKAALGDLSHEIRGMAGKGTASVFSRKRKDGEQNSALSFCHEKYLDHKLFLSYNEGEKNARAKQKKKIRKKSFFFSTSCRFPLYKNKKMHYNVHIKYTFFTPKTKERREKL
jgi:hypothetical protein